MSSRDELLETAFGDLLGVATGAVMGLRATIVADAVEKHPDVNLMATPCLGCKLLLPPVPINSFCYLES
eukprot:2037870-Amphidinium_carterae.1